MKRVVEEEIAMLRRFLRYEPDTGKLYWRERSAEDCKAAKKITSDARAKCWNGRYAGKEALTARNADGYLNGMVSGRSYLAHRVAWAIHHGSWPRHQIDHINGMPDDNRIVNLRDVTAVVNGRNMAIRRTNKSGVTGVHRTRWGTWTAYIRIDCRPKHLGSFKSLAEAASARAKAEADEGNFHPDHGRRARTTLANLRGQQS